MDVSNCKLQHIVDLNFLPRNCFRQPLCKGFLRHGQTSSTHTTQLFWLRLLSAVFRCVWGLAWPREGRGGVISRRNCVKTADDRWGIPNPFLMHHPPPWHYPLLLSIQRWWALVKVRCSSLKGNRHIRIPLNWLNRNGYCRPKRWFRKGTILEWP